MSTPQSIARVAPQLRVGQTTKLTALSVVVAIFVSILILALIRTNPTVATSPFKGSEPTGAPVTQVHRLGR